MLAKGPQIVNRTSPPQLPRPRPRRWAKECQPQPENGLVRSPACDPRGSGVPERRHGPSFNGKLGEMK